MKITNIGSRGTLFTFYDLEMPTNVYVINTMDTYFIVDTYLGEDPMVAIEDYLIEHFGNKKKIVINTHSDWDHIWGNSYFEDNLIISHEKCKEDILKNGEHFLKEHSRLKRGFRKLVVPNMTFKEKITFSEGIEVFHSPGHSVDSISIFDRVDNVLYAGDNIEYPIPFIQFEDIKGYIDTLRKYLELDADIFIGGHTEVENADIVKSNKNYLEKLLWGNSIDIEDDYVKVVHESNSKFLDSINSNDER